MGLGVLGRGVGVAKFLADCGAVLTVTDLKSHRELKQSLQELKRYKNIRYVLGRHDLKDFKDCDMVIKAAGVPLDSPYIKEAHKNKIPVEMDASLFAKLSGAKVIGITGTRGKSTVTFLVSRILKQAGRPVLVGGNIRGGSSLPLLKKAKPGDYAVLELDSWQLQGFGDSKLSPHVGVFTTFFPDHLNYYGGSMQKYFNDKANVFKYQDKEDFLVTQRKFLPVIRKFYKRKIKSRIIAVSSQDPPKSYKLKIPGEHNRDNAALAIGVGRALRIKEAVIRKAVENFRGVPGRLEYLNTVRGIKIYNDNNSTTPEATIAGLKALDLTGSRNIVLIMGGSDKGLNMAGLLSEVKKRCRAVVLIEGSGTEKIKPQVLKIKNIAVHRSRDLKDCIKSAIGMAERGDIILFSPAFASFGRLFRNEYDRNDQFVKIVNGLR
ncbi:MAG: UDP-N-acetylmuramoylalanine-D-glutamate ligase [Candidatus Yanofskybacteria bacterium GW2011_GWA2_44_9]|nr:MAG: UDP-N-acetylmuramoylalanine-D-glutamate ligase [Candidatus Yanofskybacteria bacterium GW2011_GWA2_44_9]